MTTPAAHATKIDSCVRMGSYTNTSGAVKPEIRQLMMMVVVVVEQYVLQAATPLTVVSERTSTTSNTQKFSFNVKKAIRQQRITNCDSAMV